MLKLLKVLIQIIIFIYLSINLLAQCDSSKAIFPITLENAKYLRYMYYQNNFDSAEVNYILGEFRLKNGSSVTRINVARKMAHEFIYIQGDSIHQGEDSVLINYGVSETFTYPQNSQLEFYRELTSSAPCSYPLNNDTTKWLGGSGDWKDGFWAIGMGRILDNSQFVLQLVRKSDNLVVAILDSVGVAPNPNSVLAQRYGTEPDTNNHIMNLPDSFAGRQVYLRVSPRRTGTTAYGMNFKVISTCINYSLLYDYKYITRNNCTESQINYFSSEFFSQLINYCDSVKNATGFLPGYISVYNKCLTKEQDSIFNYTYFEQIVRPSGDTIYVEKSNDSLFRERRLYINDTELKNRINENLVKIISLYPNPVTKGKLNISLDCKNELNAGFEVFTLDGKYIGKYWNGRLTPGLSNYMINVSDISGGTYFLAIINDNNEVIGLSKLIMVNTK